MGNQKKLDKNCEKLGVLESHVQNIINDSPSEKLH